mmetsp:Transcript_25036/g.68786  ORF Transcript_25036/g.68786 Transcript_25036/m.68786 type:complete len:227 (-) Transcript_25036:1289-1969(-)
MARVDEAVLGPPLARGQAEESHAEAAPVVRAALGAVTYLRAAKVAQLGRRNGATVHAHQHILRLDVPVLHHMGVHQGQGRCDVLHGLQHHLRRELAVLGETFQAATIHELLDEANVVRHRSSVGQLLLNDWRCLTPREDMHLVVGKDNILHPGLPHQLGDVPLLDARAHLRHTYQLQGDWITGRLALSEEDPTCCALGKVFSDLDGLKGVPGSFQMLLECSHLLQH